MTIKANDILAEVTKASDRRAAIHDHFRQLPAEFWNENTSYCYQLRLDETAQALATYIRKLPEAVRNKQSKAVAKATAYVKLLREEALVVSKH